MMLIIGIIVVIIVMIHIERKRIKSEEPTGIYIRTSLPEFKKEDFLFLRKKR